MTRSREIQARSIWISWRVTEKTRLRSRRKKARSDEFPRNESAQEKSKREAASFRGMKAFKSNHKRKHAEIQGCEGRQQVNSFIKLEITQQIMNCRNFMESCKRAALKDDGKIDKKEQKQLDKLEKVTMKYRKELEKVMRA